MRLPPRPASLCAALCALALAACSGQGAPSARATPHVVAGAPGAREAAQADEARPLPDPLPEVAARVNDQPIPLRSVALIAEQALRNGAVPRGQKPRAYRQAMQQLVARELLFEEAMARRLQASEKALEQAYNEARVPYKDDQAWAAYLAEQGLDVQAFRAELRVRHTVDALIAQEAEKAPPVSDRDAEEFYQKNPGVFETGERLKAAHVLIRVPREAPPEARARLRAKAEDVLRRARAGEDFGKLAKEHSEDIGSSGKGGVLDLFQRGQMVKPFEEAAYALKPGELSGVVETPFGLHVVKLLERLPSQKLSLGEVREPLKQQLSQMRRQEVIQRLVGALRAKARIETYL